MACIWVSKTPFAPGQWRWALRCAHAQPLSGGGRGSGTEVCCVAEHFHGLLPVLTVLQAHQDLFSVCELLVGWWIGDFRLLKICCRKTKCTVCLKVQHSGTSELSEKSNSSSAWMDTHTGCCQAHEGVHAAALTTKANEISLPSLSLYIYTF